MKKKYSILIIVGVILLLIAGALPVLLQLGKTQQAAEEEIVDPTYYGAYTDIEVLKDVPVFTGASVKNDKPEDYGKNNYMVAVNGSTVDEYEAYCQVLEQHQFKKHSDNGDDQMEGYVRTCAFTKDKLSLTVSHIISMDKTYISVSEKMPLSEHLIYQDAYVKENQANAQTKVHLVQLNDNGTSFVIQLKNGHFIVHDGGNKTDAPYLVDYLEELTPGDEIPVIEGWFITHAHSDHTGAVIEIATELNAADRLYVEGFYYNEPSAQVLAIMDDANIQFSVQSATLAFGAFKNKAGEKTPVYRPQLGQRYYFSDLYIDVCMTPEQFTVDTYYNPDFNDTSIWLMHHIEGQRFLYLGDASHTAMRLATYMYDKDYMNLDVYAVSHHGINVYDYFTNFCTVKTLLYTSFLKGSIYQDPKWTSSRLEENENLRQQALESYSHGEGTVVLTFPYKVGTAETLPCSDWRYNFGKPERTDWDK